MRTYWNLGKFAEAATAGATASELFLELNEVSRAAEVTRDAARLSHRNQRDTAEHGFRRAAELFKLAGKPAEAEQVEAELAALGEEATPRGVRVMVIGCAVLTALGVATFLVLLVLTW
jgi:hypothetical protein